MAEPLNRSDYIVIAHALYHFAHEETGRAEKLHANGHPEAASTHEQMAASSASAKEKILQITPPSAEPKTYVGFGGKRAPYVHHRTKK